MGSIGISYGKSFLAYSADKLPDVVGGYSYYQSQEQQKQLEDTIVEAEKAGYEIINRKYFRRGNSGTLYELEEARISAPVKNGTISKASNVWRHAKEVQKNYEDVIILQSRRATESVSRGRRGFKSNGLQAEFVVMARKRRK